jgi:GTP:adenosylcobinamide-phosphate guanylyltransferase
LRAGNGATIAGALTLGSAFEEGLVIPDLTKPRILVLAGRRSARLDPLAEAAGVSHKALVPVAGEAMIGRVLRIADQAFPDCPLFVSVEDFAVIAEEPTVKRLTAAGRLKAVEAEYHIVDSVVTASRTTGFPLIITTADNVLMTVEGLRAFAAEGAKGDVDGVLMMAEREDIMAAHPDGQRRFYKLRGGQYSNCNLFWLANEGALKITESFRYGGQFAKRKRDAVKALGLTTFFLYASKLVTIDGLFRHLSRRFGVSMRPMVVADGRLAIDVDNERTHRVAEEIIARG